MRRSHIVRRTRSVFLHLAGGWKPQRSHVEQRQTKDQGAVLSTRAEWNREMSSNCQMDVKPFIESQTDPVFCSFLCGKYRQMFCSRWPAAIDAVEVKKRDVWVKISHQWLTPIDLLHTDTQSEHNEPGSGLINSRLLHLCAFFVSRQINFVAEKQFDTLTKVWLRGCQYPCCEYQSAGRKSHF